MISTKGRYALRVLIDMVEQGQDALVPLKEIAERQHLSAQYLQHVVKALVDAGMLVGFSGRCGGYRLSRSADEYLVDEVLEAAEGTLAPVACLAPDAPECELASKCKTLPMWREYGKLTKDFFHSISIADLAKGDGEFCAL